MREGRGGGEIRDGKIKLAHPTNKISPWVRRKVGSDLCFTTKFLLTTQPSVIFTNSYTLMIVLNSRSTVGNF